MKMADFASLYSLIIIGLNLRWVNSRLKVNVSLVVKKAALPTPLLSQVLLQFRKLNHAPKVFMLSHNHNYEFDWAPVGSQKLSLISGNYGVARVDWRYSWKHNFKKEKKRKGKSSSPLIFPRPILRAVSVLFLSHKPIYSHRAFNVAIAHPNFII